MLFEEALFQQLVDASGAPEWVGDRVYPVEVPQYDVSRPSYPCIVYRLANRPGSYTLDGAHNMVESTVEISCLSANYIEAHQIARAVRLSLDNVGSNDPLAQLEVNLLGAQRIAETEIKEEDPLETVEVYNVTQTWTIKHVED